MLKSLLFYIFFNIFIFNEARVFYPFYKDHDLLHVYIFKPKEARVYNLDCV